MGKTLLNIPRGYRCFILDTLPESILVLDVHQTLVYQNLQARALYHLEDNSFLTDQMLCSVFQVDDVQLQDIRVSLEGHHRWQGQSSGRYNGTDRHLSHRIDLLPGSSPMLVIATTDITEIVAIRQNIEASSKDKIQILANLSHELRTPMIGILGSVDLLKNTSMNQYQYDHIENIQECSEQLLGTISGILDLAKIDMGLAAVNPSPCEIRILISKAFHVIETILREKGLRVHITIEESVPAMLMLDENKLQQVLVHILGNAAKFTDRGGIYLTAACKPSAQGDRLDILVADTGGGIAHSHLKRILEPFSQVDPSTTREHSGSGLGLYTCKRLLELMAGEIHIESQPGKGTSVSVRLPLNPLPGNDNQNAPPSTFEGHSEACESRFDFKPARILLVEDHLLNRKIITQMLQNYGFSVDVVNNGLECLQALHSDSYDAILMDIQMPVMDGYETTRIIRQDPSLRVIPVIAMTANSTVGDREQCLRCGCSSFIAKPFKAEELAQEIRRQIMSIPPLTSSGYVDSVVQALMPEFLDNLDEMMQDLRLAWKSRDMELLQGIAHDIKGSAGLYGLLAISQKAAQLQKAARNHDYHLIGSCLNELQQQHRAALHGLQSSISIG